MQALVCRQPIGWREEARRLLVLATDAGLHHAGDGKVWPILFLFSSLYCALFLECFFY